MTIANFLDISDILIIQMISDQNECAISFIVSLPSFSPMQVTLDINELSSNYKFSQIPNTYIPICQL